MLISYIPLWYWIFHDLSVILKKCYFSVHFGQIIPLLCRHVNPISVNYAYRQLRAAPSMEYNTSFNSPFPKTTFSALTLLVARQEWHPACDQSYIRKGSLDHFRRSQPKMEYYEENRPLLSLSVLTAILQVNLG